MANRDQMASELAARAAQRTAVAELGMRALGGIPLDRLCAELTESIRETLAVDLCELLELSPDHGAAVVKAAAGLDRATLGHTLLKGRATR